MLKRFFDVTCAGLALLILAPWLIVIGVAIKLTSTGPVFYRGVRSGLHGQSFRIFKFRTMMVAAESEGGLSTAKNDPRVTRLGRVLRQYKLDELPQLINVLRGDMSIVGPRPEFPYYTRQYTGDEELILTVRPGITDYASIQFRRLDEWLGSEEPDRIYEEHVRPVKNALRVRYVREQTFRNDLALILKTLRHLVAG